MTPDETVKMFAMIAATFPRDQSFARADRIMLNSWHTMLQDLPFDVVEAAVQAQAATSPFPPSISEIRQRAAEITKPSLRMGADEAWELAIKAVRKFGYTQWIAAKKWLPSDVAQAVERFGYRDICMAENIDVVRGQFIRLWDVRLKRERERSVLPPALAALTAGLSESLRLEDGTEDDE